MGRSLEREKIYSTCYSDVYRGLVLYVVVTGFFFFVREIVQTFEFSYEI